MELIFTQDVGRYKRGDVRSYPKGTWDQLAKSVKKPLSSFARAVMGVAQAKLKEAK